METLIVARHGESECSLRGIVNGEPNDLCPLTERGEEEARALGRSLIGRELDLCVTSEFRRTQQTARIALGKRDLPWLELADLNDVRVGAYEGGPLDLYTSWAHTHEPEERPAGGGESRAEFGERFARGLRTVFERPEKTIFVVTHGLAVSFLRETAEDEPPRRIHAPVPYARPFEYRAEEIAGALAIMDEWLKAPRWNRPEPPS